MPTSNSEGQKPKDDKRSNDGRRVEAGRRKDKEGPVMEERRFGKSRRKGTIGRRKTTA